MKKKLVELLYYGMTNYDTLEEVAEDLLKKGTIVLPCNVGTEIKDGIVDSITYQKNYGFDGKTTVLDEVGIRDKDAKGPIYTARTYSFDEFSKLLEKEQSDENKQEKEKNNDKSIWI